MQIRGNTNTENKFSAKAEKVNLKNATSRQNSSGAIKNTTAAALSQLLSKQAPQESKSHNTTQASLPKGIFEKTMQWVNETDQGIQNYFKENAQKANAAHFPVLSTISVKDLELVKNALLKIGDTDSSKTEKLDAVNTLFKRFSRTDFTGGVHQPDKIQGVPVVASAPTEDGKEGFMLANGRVVSKEALRVTQNLDIALNTIKILEGNQNAANKVIGIADNGVVLANAYEFLSDKQAGYMKAGLGVASLVTNWDELGDKDKIKRITDLSSDIPKIAKDFGIISKQSAGVAGSVIGAMGTAASWQHLNTQERVNATIQNTSTAISAVGDLGFALGKGAASKAVGGIAGGAGVVMGIADAADVFSKINDMPRNDAKKYGAIGIASAGASIGAGVGSIIALGGAAAGAATGAAVGTTFLPLVGTAFGAAVGAATGFIVGSMGSGKHADQKMRDQWRKLMEENGFAAKIEGSHHVPLADGSTYDIGKDGGHRLINVDGTERHTINVDWGNPLATNGIPEAHIFALATGLDPSLEKGALWHRSVGQIINAATSNATTQEEVSDNFRAMLTAGQVDPLAIGVKVEVLRQQGVINEDEYSIYLNKINGLFGTSIEEMDKALAAEALRDHGIIPPTKTAS